MSYTVRFFISSVLMAFVTAGCQSTVQQPRVEETRVQNATQLPSPDAWGGEINCQDSACQWIAVEHEQSKVVLYKIEGRKAVLTDSVTVAYHPDSARWLDRTHVVAAVEASQSLDVFSVSAEGKLKLIQQIYVGFAPRDVFVTPDQQGGWLMLATPYRGTEIAWVHWSEKQQPKVEKQTWCNTPWHISVASGPANVEKQLLTSCLHDRKALSLPLPKTWGDIVKHKPQLLKTFDNVPRHIQSTPSGRYWYVALELGGKVARYDTATAEWQSLNFTNHGAVSIGILQDDTVAWGENSRLLIHKYDDTGKVIAESQRKVSGFATNLQVLDIDKDGHKDILVMNSTGPQSEILWGPFFE